MSEWLHFIVVLAVVLGFLSAPVRARAQTEPSWAVWTGTQLRLKRPGALDFSGEYQVRLGDDFRNLSSHFIETLAYVTPNRALDFAGGYRLTLRPESIEHRLVVLGWWGIGFGGVKSSTGQSNLKFTQHAGYQRDFNVNYNNRYINSNSVRYLVKLGTPLSRAVEVYVSGGALLTWNEEFDFDVDKLRFIAGLRIFRGAGDILLLQYMYEESPNDEPVEQTHVIWVRYFMAIR